MAKRSRKKKELSSEIPAQAADTVSFAQWPSLGFDRDWLWGLILVLAVILTYSPLWWAGYIWDDNKLITANPVIIGPLGLKEIWTTHAADICPLTMTTFWFEHALWGVAPLPYHLVNVFLHAACVILLWRTLRSLQIPGAWLGAALWALHPVEVESVAWIAELKNTQSCLFYLLTILFFVRWLKAGENKKGSRWSYILTLLCAALAIASKSSTVILPVVLLLCAWWVEGRWRWRNLAGLGPIFLMSLAAGMVSIGVQRLYGTDDPQLARTWPERVITAGEGVWFYLGKLLWPHPLITIYPRWQIDAAQGISYLPLLVVVGVLFFLWWKRQSWARPYFLAWAYFLTALLPVLGLANMSFFRYSFVADHFQYLAAMGPLALTGTGMVRLADFAIPNRLELRFYLCAGLLFILGMLSWQRAWDYKSEETLWTDTLAKNPNCWLGQYNLGEALLEKGEADEAMPYFRKALEINPDYADACHNLGLCFMQKGQSDEAISQFQKALEIKPNYAEAYYNLGVAFTKTRQEDKAIAQFRKALEINPNYVEAHNYLGNAFSQMGRLDEAMAHYQKALEINPNFADAYNNFGIVLRQKGRLDEAIIKYQKALTINPYYADARNNLGNALVQKKQLAEAVAQYQKALGIDPDYADAHNGLGVALAKKGQLDQAIIQFQEALRFNPHDGTAQGNLAAAQAARAQKKTAPP